MSLEHEQLVAAIAALEAQRSLLGDAVVEMAQAPLRARLSGSSDATQPQVPAQQTLKHVTILFLDVVGSTSLSQQLDPEEIHAVLDGTLGRGTAIVQAHGGSILKYAGDSLLAVFGAVEAREDDVERAVRSGLALLAEGRAIGSEIASKYNFSGFNVRVGVHTGAVLLGGGLDGVGNIRGIAVHVAARMEQTAPAGALRISHATYLHVRGIFDVEAQEPIQVKGVDEPMRTYLVVRAKPKAFRVPTRSIEGIEIPLVGREAEFDHLKAAFEEALAGRRLRAVTLIADVGLGKSRLMHELQGWLDAQSDRCRVLLGRSQPSSALQPFGLLREILCMRLQIADSDGAEVARKRLVEGMMPHFREAGELQAQLLGQLIGMDFSESPALLEIRRDPAVLRSRGLAAFRNYLRQLAADPSSVLVMLLDDLHWADDASLECLQTLLEDRDLPLLLVLAGRPGLLDRVPNWGAKQEHHTRVTLSTLTEQNRRRLTSALLQHISNVPDSLHELIDSQAEGNPFYAEELVKMLIDDGAIVKAGEGWQVQPEKLQTAHIPGTLTGVLEARLDALAGPERHALQLASIIGPVFWDDALVNVDPAAAPELSALQRKGMIYVRPESAFGDTTEECFHHHLLHQVTYNTVLRATRQAAHARCAAWLAQRVGERGDEYLSITAAHFERCGDTAEAIAWYERAHRAAVNRHAIRAALQYVERMLAMPELTDPHKRYWLHTHLLGHADVLSDRELHALALEKNSAIAEQLDDDFKRAEVAANRALFADRLGRPAEAGEWAQKAAALSERSDCASAAALAYGELAWLARDRRDIAEARRLNDIALEWAKKAGQRLIKPGDDVYEAMLLVESALISNTEFDPETAARVMNDALALALRLNRPRMVCHCYGALAETYVDLGNTELAERNLDALEELAGRMNYLRLSAQALKKRAELALRANELDRAHALAVQVELEYKNMSDGRNQAQCQRIQADTHASQGDHVAAQKVLENMRELYIKHEHPTDATVCRLLIADCLRAQGDKAGAVRMISSELEALNAVGALDAADDALKARMAIWRVLADGGDPSALHHLQIAGMELKRQTEKIQDPLVLERALSNVPIYREVVAALKSAGG